MSGNSNAIPDSGRIDKGDKCDIHDPQVDSGFLSGPISESLLSGEDIGVISEENSDLSEQQRINREMLKESNLYQDSGVSLSESFSNLSLKKPDLNNLSSTNLNQQPQPPVPEQPKIEIWEKYYEQDKDGDTHLHNAIVCGRIQIVDALIKIAPHPRLLDTPNDDAQTPLHLAIETNQYKIARMLLVAGARPSPRDIRGDSPLHIACRNGDIMCVKALMDPVQQIERDRLNLKYPYQINSGIDLNQWNYVGQTCVHVAALNGHVDTLRHLYWYGANINAREGCMGYTALHMAVERQDEELVKFLLTECPNLDPHTTTYGRKSALQLTPILPENLLKLLTYRGISPYNSEDEYEDDSDSDDDMYEQPLFVPNLVGASA